MGSGATCLAQDRSRIIFGMFLLLRPGNIAAAGAVDRELGGGYIGKHEKYVLLKK